MTCTTRGEVLATSLNPVRSLQIPEPDHKFSHYFLFPHIFSLSSQRLFMRNLYMQEAHLGVLVGLFAYNSRIRMLSRYAAEFLFARAK